MSLIVASTSGVIKHPNENPLSLKKAIKDYQDELLTGLTEDERKEIEAKIDAYIKEHSKNNDCNSKSFIAALDAYIKSLLKEYGFKGGDTFDAVLDSCMKKS